MLASMLNIKEEEEEEEHDKLQCTFSKTVVLFITEVFFFTSWLNQGERISL
jgi:hypothetical protein